MKPIDMALEILRKTDDGDKLDPGDLCLLQAAVNGWLEEPGEIAFYDLYKRVSKGQYQKPWLQGVTHLTRDHEGFVFWKEHEIEHWSGDLPYSKEGKQEAQELARRCKILESRGQPITTNTIIWNWPD